MCLLLCNVSEFSGQQYFFKNFSVEQGLSQSEVGDIVQDQSGRLFLRTVSSGIDVFDGEQFSRITREDGLLTSFVTKLYKDRNEQIWLASTLGLNRYRKDSVLAFPFDHKIGSVESVFSMLDSKENGLLIGTNKGLIQFKDYEFEIIDSTLLRVFSMIEYQGSLFLGTEKGLYEFNDGTVKRKYEKDIPSEQQILAMCQDQMGALILGTQKGIYTLKDEVILFKRITKSPNNSVISALCTFDNTLVLGTNGDGLAILYPNGHEEFIDESMGLSDNYIWSLMEDDEHNIWIGTSGAGIDLYSEDQFRIFSTEDGLQNDIVYDIIEDDLGRIWFGIIQGGISIYDGEKIESFNEKDGLSHRTIRCFHKEGEKIYIGTENGLSIYENGLFRDVSEKYGLKDNAIFDIHRSKDGTLWFACKGERYYGPNGGVMSFKDGIRKAYKKEDGLGSENVFHIHERTNGELWFGTDDGIFVFNDHSFSRLHADFNGECNSTVISIAEDYLGNIWIGTIGGLAHFDGKSITCFDNLHAYTNKSIFFLENKGDSSLWIGSSEGLEELSIPYFYKHNKLRTVFYNDQNGFFGSECNQNAVYKDSQGNWWFGTIKAAIKYNPNEDKVRAIKPNIDLTKISLNGNETAWKKLGFKLDSLNGMPENLELAYDQNDLLIEYQGVYLKDPDALTYRFKLDGLNNNNWSDYSDQKSIFYSNLLPGDYCFYANVLNQDTGLSSTSSPFYFSIKPAFWQTKLFQIALVLGVLILFALFIQRRMNNIRAKEKTKQDFQTRLHEVEMKALRAQMNPHFIFNSLNSINHFIIKNEKELASEYLTKFSRLIRQVLQNSKEKLVTLEEELNALNLYVELESLRFQNKFDYSVISNLKSTHFRLPPLLLQPFVENAIWHGLLHLKERKGKLKLELNQEDNELEIIISDNGIGRKRSKAIKSKNAIKKKSLGLKINSDRLKLAEILYNSNTSLKIEDLTDENGRPNGTRVILKINYN